MPSTRPLLGIHHVSALTGEAQANVEFYTGVLGLRPVLRTVNQDDPTSYHLFYGDATGGPGTDLTFFDVSFARDHRPGSGLISGTSLRVRGADPLEQWARRLDEHDVRRTSIHRRAGRQVLTLFDEEGQIIHLVDDAANLDRLPDTTPWTDGPVPAPMAIHGLGPVEITVEEIGPTREVLIDVLGFSEARPYEVAEMDDASLPSDWPISSLDDASEASVFETGPGGAAAEVHVVERPNDPKGWLGAGGVHHFALRTENSETIRAWRERIADAGLQPSPVIHRHYFESVYVREPGGILIEIATDTGAPFPVEDAMAGRLSLPPSLESKRSAIEDALPTLDPPPVGKTPS